MPATQTETSKSIAAPESDTVPAANGVVALEGSLEMLPVAELMQFFHLQGRPGVLSLADGARRPVASLVYGNRALIHAACRGIEGDEAVFEALALTTGHFRFISGAPGPHRQTISTSVPNLILEGFRRLESLSRFSIPLPADDRPFYLAPVPPQDDIRLTAKEWAILSLVDGKRTVRQLIDASAREEQEVRATLAGLLTADLILTERDDRFLDLVVPKTIKLAQAGVVRFAPPTLLANLIIKKADGTRSLRRLLAEFGIDESPFFDELRLLVRTRWIGFASGEAEFERWVGR